MDLSRELESGSSKKKTRSRRRWRKKASSVVVDVFSPVGVVTRSVSLRSVAVVPTDAMAEREISVVSPKEEGELEDGEISDADSGCTRGGGSLKDLRFITTQRVALRRYSPPQAYRIKEQSYRSPTSGSVRTSQQCENNQRLSFWERSSTVLDRLRYRVGGRGRSGSRGGSHKPYWEDERGGGRDRNWGTGSGEKSVRPLGGNNNGNNSGSNWRESSTRKLKSFCRSPTRKPSHPSKGEGSGDESFEDLLVKYKQIKLELEHIKKDEKLALITKQGNVQQECKKKAESQDQNVKENSSVAKDNKDLKIVKHFNKAAKGIKHFNKDIKAFKQMNKDVVELKDSRSGHKDDKPEVIDLTQDDEENCAAPVAKIIMTAKKPVFKPFQAFEIKPLRQKLIPPVEQNKLETKLTVPIAQNKPEIVVLETELLILKDEPEEPSPDQEENGASCESNASDPASERLFDDEEEISELNLRLLALQSASKKWQEKEQEVMKESKEKLTKPKTLQQKVKASPKTNPAKKVSPSYAAKQALRKQKTKAWLKLQQEKEQELRRKEEEEQKKQAEDEEKREEEIRKIRDLSNQEEQYNRFMKLVGGKRQCKDKAVMCDLNSIPAPLEN